MRRLVRHRLRLHPVVLLERKVGEGLLHLHAVQPHRRIFKPQLTARWGGCALHFFFFFLVIVAEQPAELPKVDRIGRIRLGDYRRQRRFILPDRQVQVRFEP